ncbi:MAG TPA: amidohydrolase family protein [Opitutales bacterium]|nr:amidohydrolase family protein [Opitutales bacterium]
MKAKKSSPRRTAGVIDAHTHAYPPEIFADPAGWAKARDEHHWAQLMGPRVDGKRSLQGFADRGQMLRAMDAAGVERAVLLGWYWEQQKTCVWHNAVMAEWLRASPDRFSAFASVQPRAGNVVLDDLRRAQDRGFLGMGEIFPAAQGFAMEDPVWEAVLAWAAEEKMPVNLHVPEPAGRDYPGFIGAPLRDYQRLARRHPRVNFIFAHWGGLLPLLELNPAVRADLRNVYYDTAASPLLYDPAVYRRVADAVGAERILFGSDYPLRVFPRAQKEPDFTRPLAEVKKSGLAKKELAQVLGGNTRKLLRL